MSDAMAIVVLILFLLLVLMIVLLAWKKTPEAFLQFLFGRCRRRRGQTTTPQRRQDGHVTIRVDLQSGNVQSCRDSVASASTCRDTTDAAAVAVEPPAATVRFLHHSSNSIATQTTNLQSTNSLDTLNSDDSLEVNVLDKSNWCNAIPESDNTDESGSTQDTSRTLVNSPQSDRSESSGSVTMTNEDGNIWNHTTSFEVATTANGNVTLLNPSTGSSRLTKGNATRLNPSTESSRLSRGNGTLLNPSTGSSRLTKGKVTRLNPSKESSRLIRGNGTRRSHSKEYTRFAQAITTRLKRSRASLKITAGNGPRLNSTSAGNVAKLSHSTSLQTSRLANSSLAVLNPWTPLPSPEQIQVGGSGAQNLSKSIGSPKTNSEDFIILNSWRPLESPKLTKSNVNRLSPSEPLETSRQANDVLMGDPNPLESKKLAKGNNTPSQYVPDTLSQPAACSNSESQDHDDTHPEEESDSSSSHTDSADTILEVSGIFSTPSTKPTLRFKDDEDAIPKNEIGDSQVCPESDHESFYTCEGDAEDGRTKASCMDLVELQGMMSMTYDPDIGTSLLGESDVVLPP